MVGVEGGAAPPPAVFSLDWFVGELATAARNGDTSLRRLCDSADRIAVAQERIANMLEARELWDLSTRLAVMEEEGTGEMEDRAAAASLGRLVGLLSGGNSDGS
jgi:hypothetical protein